MEKFFSKYKRFLGTVFLLWVFLWVAGKFGFNFGVELFLLFKLVFFLGVIWVIGEIWINWDAVYPVLKTFSAKQKSEFSNRAEVTQRKIIAISPKLLAGRAGTTFALGLTAGVLPFLTLWQTFQGISQIAFSKTGILIFCALGILIDIFVFSFTSDLVILFLAGLWIWAVRRWKFEGRVSVAGALVFLVMCPFLLIVKKNLIAEKSAIWAYMFLVVGVGQMFIEDIKRGERRCERGEC